MSAQASSAALTATLDDSVCSVAGMIDFQTASACLDTVTGYIESQPSLVIDMAGVTRSNSVGLALMVEWLALARRHGHQVSFRAVPNGLRELAGVCQVDSLIDSLI